MLGGSSINYPTPSTTYIDYRVKEALNAIVNKPVFEAVKCQGCLQPCPTLDACSECLKQQLKKRLMFASIGKKGR